MATKTLCACWSTRMPNWKQWTTMGATAIRNRVFDMCLLTFSIFRKSAMRWAVEEEHFNVVHMLAKVTLMKKRKIFFSQQCFVYNFGLKFWIILGSCEQKRCSERGVCCWRYFGDSDCNSYRIFFDFSGTLMTLAAYWGQNSVMLTFMAWGVTGNESNRDGLVIFQASNFQKLIRVLIYSVLLRFITPHSAANLTRQSCWALPASTRTRSITKAKLHWLPPSPAKKSKVCAHCSSSTLIRARRQRNATRQLKLLRCLNNTNNVQ